MGLLVLPLSAQVMINEYSVSNLSTIQDNYLEYEDWIEIYNKNFTSANLSGYYLSDDTAAPMMWALPEGTVLPAGGMLVVWASGRNEVLDGHYHASFRLTQAKANPDQIVLSDPTGAILEYHVLEITQSNHSRGRITNGADDWGIFVTPTPGYNNASQTAYSRYADKPVVSDTGGFYNSALSVTITCEANANIRYTLDGTDPVSNSTLYTAPVGITSTKVLKARTYSNNTSVLPSLIEFNTYFINKNHTLPVLSVAGNDLLELLNGNQTLRPRGSIEFWDELKNRNTLAYGEFNEHGQDSWVHPQRSIDYITRDEAGYNNALYQKFFTLSDRDEFQRVILRAAGDDNYPGIDTSAHLRDDYVQTLSQRAGQHLDWRKSKRVVLYANGNYWGIYSIREKVHDHDYTQYYYDQGKYDIQFIMLWGWTWAEYGGQQALDDWYELRNFIMSSDLTNDFVYQAVTGQYDITSLVDYVILNSYVVCSDWMNWNVGWWRGLNPEGSHRKWAYILWDEDATFGHYINYTGIPAQSPYVSPCFPEGLTEPWQDPEGHIALLNKFRTNDDFNQYYISRYIDLLNTAFNNDFALNLLDSMAATIAPEMIGHTARWGGSVAQWESNVQRIRDFITTRNSVVGNGLKICYGLTGPYSLAVDVEPEGAGLIRLNSLDLSQFPWEANYYGGVDIKLTAMETNTGYEFDRWVLQNHEVLPNDSALDVTLSLTTGDLVVALFKPRIFLDSLVINEINYNSAAGFDPGDWVELYNPHEYGLDITGWIFKDEDDQHAYEFPIGTVIPSDGFLILCRDTAAFHALFPEVVHYLGNMDFGLAANGELIRLYDNEGTLIDTVHYDDQVPWPTEPDGNGPTLELINPAWDNALAESWASSALHGTPGERNGTWVGLPDRMADEPEDFIVYPNPLSEWAIMKAGDGRSLAGTAVRMYDLFGRQVMQVRNLFSSQVLIRRDGLPAGLYLFKVTDMSGRLIGTGKVVVK